MYLRKVVHDLELDDKKEYNEYETHCSSEMQEGLDHMLLVWHESVTHVIEYTARDAHFTVLQLHELVVKCDVPMCQTSRMTHGLYLPC